MLSVMELECIGGPHDGLHLRIVPCTTFSFDAVRLSTGEITKDTYALEATTDGRFTLRYISTHNESVQ
jgi:hypothetical protein